MASPVFGARGGANLREDNSVVTLQNRQKDAKNNECIITPPPNDAICETKSTTDF